MNVTFYEFYDSNICKEKDVFSYSFSILLYANAAGGKMFTRFMIKEEGDAMDTNQLKLIKKAVKGDPDAYGRLISEHQEYLYKMAYLYVRNEDTALDVVGTTILNAYQSIRSLKEPEYFKTWITRILIHIAQGELRKAVYYSELDQVELPDRYHGVSLEEKYDINSAINQLSEKYRTVIYLKYFSEFTIKEIAFAMNAPEGSVKAYLSRAREELKQILKEDYVYAD